MSNFWGAVHTMEFSDDANKEIYLYNQEDTNVGITVNSTAGNISSVKVRGGGNRPLDEATKDSAVQIDGFGWSYTQTVTETAGPVTMNITGKTNERFLGLTPTNRREDQNSVLGARYLVITDAAGGKVEAPSNGSNQPGYFNLVVKSQTYKYSIQQPELNGDKIGVADINNLTAADIQKIKDQINIEYSKTNTDARLTSKKGTVLENKSDVVKNIEVDGQNITVTYKDDSTDTATISSVVRTNEKPTVEIKYSDPAPNKKEVYVYASEVNSFDIKIKDDSGKLASAELRRGSNQSFKDVAGETNKQDTQYGFTANKFTSETTATAEKPTVITYNGTPAPEGNFTKEKFEAAIQNGGTPLGWRFVRAIDKDGADARGDGGTAADPTAVNVILKPQTLKYDIKTPEEADKVAVTDASNITDAEFARVKEKIKLEYSQNNSDERLADKKGTLVDVQEQPSRIQSITRDADNNVVVTYADGSKDKKPLSELVRVNNAPEVKIPYSVDGKKDVYVYANEDVNIDIKYTDDSGKIASAVVNKGGNQPLGVKNPDNPNILDNEYDMTLEKISVETPATVDNPAIVKIRGLVTKETPGLKADKFPKGDTDEYRLVTRYATATDTDGREILNNATSSTYATDPGSFTIVLKSQTKKYDIKELDEANKIVVTDTANIPADELAKIKENIPLEYSKKNEDKNLEAKKGTAVEKADAAKVVDTLVQKGENLEVTYKDGSKDTIPVDKVVKLDKQPAIDAVNNKATDQITAINNNAALTPAEKEKAIAKVNEDKTVALGKIDEATNNGAIETAKNDGNTAVSKVNPVAKEAAKQAVADALKAKNDALDAREDLTQKEIEDAKAAAKAEADKAIVKINEQPDTAPTPAEATTAQTAVDTGKTDGTAAIAKINPIGKQAALDKIDEALKAKEKEIDDRTDLTDEEKKEVKDKAKEIANTKKAEINAKKNNADTEAEAGTIQGEINTAGTEGADAITALVKNPAKKPEANTAVTNAAEAKKQSIQDDTALSPEAKKKLQDEVDEIKKASEEAINGAKKNANVDKAKKAAETAIAAINSARLPGNKLVAKNPTNLDAEEQEKLKKAIEAVNPGATVTVNQDGSASVTLPNGKTEPLKQVDLTKDASALETAGGGNNINRPTDKVIVKNPDQLTDEDKEKIKKAVRDVNPNAVVSIDDAGTVTVSTPEGNTAAFPAKELVRTLEDAGKDGSGNVGILKPADKVVGNATNSADQEKATAKLKKLNGADATVQYDAEGNATVVRKDGTIATIPAADLFKTPEDASKVNGGDDINKPNAQTVVADMATLSPEERTKVKDAIKAKVEAVNPGAVVVVDDKGNAIVTTPEGKTAVIDADDLIKKPNETSTAKAGNNINNPADRVQVADKAELTEPELARIKVAVEAVNPGATVVVDDKGNTTVTTPEGKTATIPASDLVKTNNDLTDPAKQDAVKKPADKTLVKNPTQLSQEEKDTIKAAVAKVNPENTTVVVDDKGNATVTTPDGKTEVIPASDLVKTAKEAEGANAGNNINKPADKVSATPADLTGDKKDEVKDKIQKAVESVNPGATVFVDDKGSATVTTPDGKTATIPVEDLLKDPAAKETPSAGNKVNTPAEKALVDPAVLNDPNATLPKDVKAAVQKAVESVNSGATVVVDDKGNATVTVTNPDGTKTTATIPALDLVKSNAKEDLENAAKQDAIKKPIDQTVVADKDALTEPEKEAIKAKVQEVNPGATVVVDAKGNATVTTPEGKTAVIPADDLVKTADEVLTDPKAGNVINKPADRELVADKDHLTPDDIKAIKDRVAAVNPGASVYVDDKGNATVTTKDGQTATIPVNDLVKTEADKNTANAGNKVNTPADKVLVKDPAKLTAEEVEEIEKKIKEVNPGAEVVFDDKGNATVKTKEGNIATIPVSDLVKPKADLLDPAKQDAVKKPADKTLVKNPDLLTLEEKKEIEAKVKAVNPPADGTTVFVDDKGNATVTTKDGKTVVIPKDDLVKTEAEAANEKAGNNINKPADKVSVKDKDQLTEDDKKAIAAKVKAVNPGAEVFVDEKGNATVTLKDGKSATIPATDLVKSPEDATKSNATNKVNTPADKVVVKDPDTLTDTDKEAIIKKIQEVNPEAKVVFDKYGNATVTTKDGAVATIPAKDLVKTEADAAKPNAGNDVVKPADKTVVANPERLTDAEKESVKKAVESVNPGSTVVVDDKGNATVTTPDGKTAVIPATDLTKSEADAAKPKAGNDIVKPADKTVVANPDLLTQDEKDAIAAKVKAVNSGAEVVVDDKGNATVTLPNRKTAVIPASDLTKNADVEKAPKAGNDIVKPASKVLVKNPDSLTQDEKDAIVAKVAAVNPGSTVVVDDKGNATVTTPDGKTAVIPASDLTKSEKDVNDGKAKDNAVTPAAKTKVANPEKLTDAEKKAIEDKVKTANPGATVVVDDKGNATVVKDGNVSVIPSTDLVKVEDDATKPNGGNDANTPTAKTVVADPANLTDEEKEKVKKAVEAVNPGATVVVDEKGNATVTKANGTVLNIPASDLVIPSDNLADEATNAKVKTPAFRTLVGNKDNLTDDEKAAVKKAIEAVNPGATVVVDDKGNATVTMPDGSTATISKEQLVKDKEDVSNSKHGGDNLDIDLSKVEVTNLANITPEEKAKFQFMILGAINSKDEFNLDEFSKETDEQGNTVYTSKDSKVKITIDKDGNMKVTKDGKTDLVVNIDKDGNVTIVTKEGQVLAIPRDDVFKQRPYVPQYDNTDSKVDKSKLESGIRNLDSLIASQLDAVKVKEAKALLAEAKEVFGNPNATQAEVDAMVKRLEEFKLNQASVATDDQTANNAANASNGETSDDAAEAKLAENISKRNNQKELPNTGTSTLGTVLPAITALLSGVGVFATKKKEDE